MNELSEKGTSLKKEFILIASNGFFVEGLQINLYFSVFISNPSYPQSRYPPLKNTQPHNSFTSAKDTLPFFKPIRGGCCLE